MLQLPELLEQADRLVLVPVEVEHHLVFQVHLLLMLEEVAVDLIVVRLHLKQVVREDQAAEVRVVTAAHQTAQVALGQPILEVVEAVEVM